MYQSTKKLWARASGLIDPSHETGMWCSFALPIVDHGRLAIGVFYYPLAPHPKNGAHILAPTRVLFVDAETGERTADDEARRRLANVMYLPELGWVTRTPFPASQYDARVAELCGLYDALTPWFARGLPQPGGKKLAATFLERLDDLEPRMMPYYRGAAPEFFGWVEHAAKAVH